MSDSSPEHRLDWYVPQRDCRKSRLGVMCLGVVLCLLAPALAEAQSASDMTPGSGPQKCTALTALSLETAPGGPAIITSARLVDVPANGLEKTTIGVPSGYGNTQSQIVSRVHQYCDVAGYVAPQNKFELKLPSPGEWNQK